MGAYLSRPVTEKETYSGSNKFLEYGGASMQGWRKSMEDAHIAVLDLGNESDTAMFGVFDGHGGSEVARFCQRYMADEITKLEHYHQGRLGDSLVEVFHRIDLMLKDQQYSQELAGMRREQEEEGGMLEAGPPDGAPNGEVSNTDAMQLLRRVLALRKQGGSPTAPPGEPEEVAPGALGLLPAPAEGAPPLALADPAIESMETEKSGEEEPSTPPPSVAAPQIQAGCTAVVAVFQGNQLYVANAGDSRAVLCRGPDAIALSEDHKPASETEKARITAAGGFISSVGGVVRVNGNLNLSRAIGDLRYKSNEQLPAAAQIISAQPDVTQTTLSPADSFLVLACDGVWDVMSNQEVVNFVGQRLSEHMGLSEIAGQLLDACLAGNPSESMGIGCDNMTATIVLLQPRPMQQPSPA